MSLASEYALRRAAKRARWANVALAASAEELREHDTQAAAAFAAQAERVASLIPDRPQRQLGDRRGELVG